MSIEGYIIQQSLGSGYHGHIWQSLRIKDKRTFALKEMQSTKRGTELYNRELESLKSIGSHSNIVCFFEDFKREDKLYIVLEYCNFGTLNDYVINQNPPNTMLTNIMMDVTGAADYINTKNIIHRDLHPENILLCSHGERIIGKISDLGMSRPYKGVMLESSYDASRNCRTKPYVAPEVIFLHKYDKKCDVFSLGATFLVIHTKQKWLDKKSTRVLLRPTVKAKPHVSPYCASCSQTFSTDVHISQKIETSSSAGSETPRDIHVDNDAVADQFLWNLDDKTIADYIAQFNCIAPRVRQLLQQMLMVDYRYRIDISTVRIALEEYITEEPGRYTYSGHTAGHIDGQKDGSGIKEEITLEQWKKQTQNQSTRKRLSATHDECLTSCKISRA